MSLCEHLRKQIVLFSVYGISIRYSVKNRIWLEFQNLTFAPTIEGSTGVFATVASRCSHGLVSRCSECTDCQQGEIEKHSVNGFNANYGTEG